MISAPVNDTTRETTPANASPVRQNTPEVQPAARKGFSRAQSIFGNQAVLRMLNRSGAARVLQRKCACEGSGEECDSCAEKKETALHRQAANHAEPNGIPPIVHEVLRSPGRPLDGDTRAFMEPRFGFDFSGVRTHSDAKAIESARAVNAHAYTVGNHIVLGAGEYSPETHATRRLLAHELAHVIQQRNSASFQGFGISNPGDPLEQEADAAADSVVFGSSARRLSQVGNSLQRQACDPFDDPLCEKKKEEKKEEKPLDPTTKKAYDACPKLCKTYPPVEVAPNLFVAVCDDTPAMGGATVRPVGCTPNRQGKLGFFSGAPAWALPKTLDACNLETCIAPGAGPTKGIEIGYIQTVEDCLSGGVYYRKDPSGWVWAGNKWWCVKNSRDGELTSTAPWYGDAKGNAGPKPFGDCPLVTDTPNVDLFVRQKTTQIAPGVEGGGEVLRWLRIEGNFHLWLVAKLPGGSLVYIHHWSFHCEAVSELKPDDADPCNQGQWNTQTRTKVTTKGPGQGSATPVLTGDVANKTKTDCSTP